MSDRGAVLSEKFASRLRDVIGQVDGTRGISAFAERAGVPLSTLNKYLRGTEPGLNALIRLADAAGTTIDILVGHTDGDLRRSGAATKRPAGSAGRQPDLAPRLAAEVVQMLAELRVTLAHECSGSALTRHTQRSETLLNDLSLSAATLLLLVR